MVFILISPCKIYQDIQFISFRGARQASSQFSDPQNSLFVISLSPYRPDNHVCSSVSYSLADKSFLALASPSLQNSIIFLRIRTFKSLQDVQSSGPLNSQELGVSSWEMLNSLGVRRSELGDGED